MTMQDRHDSDRRQATLTVAANNSTAWSKRCADYVCSGANDDVEIQAALDALPAAGGCIFLMEGTFTLGAQVVRAIDDVKFIGCGNATLLNLDGGTAVITAGAQDGWLFAHFASDAGGPSIAGATQSAIRSVWIAGVRTDDPAGAGGDAVITVAANNTPAAQKARADFTCSGANDEVTIQALVAAGVTVKLMVGDYVFNAALNIVVSNFRLEGSGKGTVIAGVTAASYIIVGDNSTFIENVTICDLAIDGTSQTAGHGIFLDGHASYHIDNCRIANCLIENCDDTGIDGEYIYYCDITDNLCIDNHDGIYLDNAHYNMIADNICDGNFTGGISLFYGCNYNTIVGNLCSNSNSAGIWLFNVCCDNTIVGNTCFSNAVEQICLQVNSDRNTITGNSCNDSFAGGKGITIDDCQYCSVVGNNCVGNYSHNGIQLIECEYCNITGNICNGNGIGTTKRSGIYLQESHQNTISGNNCGENGLHGIEIYRSDYNTITGNTCDSQVTGDGIHIVGDATYNSDYNFLTGNICRDNASHGIEIVGGTDANENRVINNKLLGNAVAEFADAGNDTQLATYVVPFVDGTDPQDSGYLIDATTEMARAYFRLPPEVQQVVRMEVYARAKTIETHEMELEMVVKGGADNEPYATHDGSIAALDSISVNFAADDVIFWRNTEAGTLALLGGDSVEVKVLHAPVEGENLDTQAYFRTVEIQYV